MKSPAMTPGGARRLLVAAAASLLLVSCGSAGAPEAAAADGAAGAVAPPYYPTHNGYIHTQSCDGGTSTLTLGAGGSYSLVWSNVGDCVAGLGWLVGGPRTLSFSAALTVS